MLPRRADNLAVSAQVQPLSRGIFVPFGEWRPYRAVFSPKVGAPATAASVHLCPPATQSECNTAASFAERRKKMPPKALPPRFDEKALALQRICQR